MLSLLLLFLTLVANGIITKIGAIALEITGMNPEAASFQAMSAYSGVGYTTREAEAALSNKQRRNIIKLLIRIGGLGIISTLAALLGTLLSSHRLVESFFDDTYFSWIPQEWINWLPINLTQLTLIALIGVLYFISQLMAKPPLSRMLREFISVWLQKENWVTPVKYEQLYTGRLGYGLVSIDICPTNPLRGKLIREADLGSHDVAILMIERMDETIVHPPSHLRIEAGDRLICFGPLGQIQERACAPETTSVPKQSQVPELPDPPLPVGTLAPDFSLADQTGHQIKLSDFRGKKNVILVFYPKDETLVCTSQLAAFNSVLDKIRDADTEVLGINPASQKAHAKFCGKLGAGFSILSDTGKLACKAYQCLAFGGLLVNRTVYGIDKDGVIVFAERGMPNPIDVIQAFHADPSLHVAAAS